MTHTRDRAADFEVFRSPREAFVGWVKRQRVAHDLSRMPDRLLEDIGIERSDITEVTRRGR
jgi:uncharacterized protein YjiS (DUF1127 family)